MKVRCVRLLDAFGKRKTTSQWLTLGETYPVLEISIALREEPKFRIVSNQSATPALFHMSQFEIKDPAIPPSWIVTIEDWGMSIGPLLWSKPGFWERYFNGDSEAIRIFEQETQHR